ncbi:MAG: family 78 glycoside hydrolase catalytic domain, partial [Oscillospiraceae bacterium]|nr:family 78 glycoside hydrolase catalytic domain [Oscillospiraceae bacterium]
VGMLFESKWITYKTGVYASSEAAYGNPAPYFRKTFALLGKLKKATLFASAFGVFYIQINGKPVGRDYLSPGWVDYSKKLPFVRYDVTALLTDNNGIGVVLGDGWAVGHLGSSDTFKRNGYNDRIEFTALLRMEYENGETEEISTDSTWRATVGAIRRSDIYMGEYVDAREDLGDISAADYDDSGWDVPEEIVFKFSRNIYLEEVKIPPIVVKHRFNPKLLRKRDNAYLYDVEQNISGVLSCVFKGERGAKIVLRHGELLSDGELYTENLRKAEATDTYILSGTGEEQFRPLFTFHGFRYAELKVEGNAEIISVTAEAMYTDLEATGAFSCSDPIATKVYQNALWGQRDNFLNVPTDCPQRDERLGWTGDAQIFCQSAMFNMDCRSFYEKYLGDIRDAQLGNGIVPAVAPLPPVGTFAYTGYDAAAGWSEAIAEIPWCHYRMYGDKKILRDNLPAAKRLLDYYETESPSHIRGYVGRYGDWLSLGTKTDLSVVSTLYYARCAWLVGEMCHILGDFEEARYKNLYDTIRSAFREKFVSETGMIHSDTQSAYVIAYQFGLIDINEAKENLERKWLEDEQKLTCGFLGIRFLLPTLCEIGRSDIAYHLITTTEYPSWGYSIKNGATTIWERWDSFTYENGIRKGMNSFNHYSLGSCTEWMYTHVLGIRPSAEAPAFEKLTLCPYLDFSGHVTSAEGHYDSDHGRVEIKWERAEAGYRYTVAAPASIPMEASFPGCTVVSHVEEAGVHTFYLKKS